MLEQLLINPSSPLQKFPEMIFQLGIPNFTNFTGKHLSWILFSKIILKKELFFAILKPLMYNE